MDARNLIKIFVYQLERKKLVVSNKIVTIVNIPNISLMFRMTTARQGKVKNSTVLLCVKRDFVVVFFITCAFF